MDSGGVSDTVREGLDDALRHELEELEKAHLRRRLREVTTPQGAEIHCDGQRCVNFASNDYLGLAGESFMAEAAAKAARDYGVGSGASRLISGTQTPHLELERELALFKETEASLAFACGYSTALGTIPALVGNGDVVILDKLSHASLVDGARLSGATMRVFPHNDTETLASHLRWAREKYPQARVLVVTESVFSMDGDLAPLSEIVALKEKHGAWLMLDEAHGVGVVGEGGRGLVQALGMQGRVEVQMGTLGKALGAAGGYIAGSRVLVDFLVNRARSFIFSTAPPPAQAAAAAAAVRWLQTGEGRARVERLASHRALLAGLCRGLVPEELPSAIVPVMVGEEGAALEVAAKALQAGYYLPAVRYPTVPKGKARLRLTLTATQAEEQVRRVAAYLDSVLLQ